MPERRTDHVLAEAPLQRDLTPADVILDIRIVVALATAFEHPRPWPHVHRPVAVLHRDVADQAVPAARVRPRLSIGLVVEAQTRGTQVDSAERNLQRIHEYRFGLVIA